MATQKKALLVEDNDDLRALMQQRLRRAGLTVNTAADGEGALHCGLQDPPDVVFIDYRLPDMNGTEVVRQMRTCPNISAAYVAVTGMDPQDIMKESRDVGIDHIAQKPLSFQELRRILRKLKCLQDTPDP